MRPPSEGLARSRPNGRRAWFLTRGSTAVAFVSASFLLAMWGCQGDGNGFNRVVNPDGSPVLARSSCGNECGLAVDARPFAAALAVPDSLNSSVYLADFQVQGVPGAKVAIWLQVDPGFVSALPSDARVLVSVDGQVRDFHLREIASSRVVVYQFVNARTVRIQYSLSRNLPQMPQSDRIRLTQYLESANLKESHTPWVQAPGSAAAALAAESGCAIAAASSTVCGVDITVNPFAGVSSRIGGTFQSGGGTGASSTIIIIFSEAVRSVTITIHDPTWGGNSAIAYDADGKQLGSVGFAGNGTPGTTSLDTKTLAYIGIRRVVLNPAPNDYVAYDASFGPDTCPPSGDPEVTSPIGVQGSILDSRAVRQGFQDALRHSNPDATPGTGVKKERGGVIFFDTTTKSFFTQELVDPNATECTYKVPAFTSPPGSIAVAIFHTHPSHNGQLTYGCPDAAQTPTDGKVAEKAQPDARKNGGGSPGDWGNVALEGYSDYVITKTGTLYKLTEAYSDRSKWKDNPYKWELKSNLGCPTLFH